MVVDKLTVESAPTLPQTSHTATKIAKNVEETSRRSAEEDEEGSDQEQRVTHKDDDTQDWSTLISSGKLYDREEEQRLLLDRFHQIMDHDLRELVLVTGPSGNGKTVLARSLREHVERRRGCFLSGKFDQLQRPESSFGAIVQAFTEYVRFILEQDHNRQTDASDTETTAEETEGTNTTAITKLEESSSSIIPNESKAETVRRKVAAAIGHEGQRLLIKMIPALQVILRDPNLPDISESDANDDDHSVSMRSYHSMRSHHSTRSHLSTRSYSHYSSAQRRRKSNSAGTTSSGGFEVLRRFRFVFTNFVKAICSRESPIVLFIDDLQWANKESVDLLAALLTDDSLEGFMVLGACRGNEVSFGAELSVMLRGLEDTKQLSICDVQVGCLQVNAVHSMLSDLFSLPLERCASLARVVHDYTQGNPFGTLQFIRSLTESGILKITGEGSHKTMQVDYSGLDSFWASTGEDIGGLLLHKLRQLSLEVQEFLQVAACLGSEFDRALVERIVQQDSQQFVEQGKEVGFVAPVKQSTKCVFSHDRVQQAVYSMIADKPAFHLHVCRRLWNSYETTDELFANSLPVVNQLCHGYHLITDEAERLHAAQLCLHAGRLCMQASSFRTAATYLEAGRQLLGKRTAWRDSYDLALSLFSLSAEVEYAIGNPRESSLLVNEVLANARNMKDRIQAYCTRIYSLGSQHQLQEAMDEAMTVLRKLKEPLPRNAGLPHVVMDFVKTSIMLRGKTDGSILRLEWMQDGNKLAAMKVLNVVFVYFFISKPILAPLLAMRMVQMTLKHGLCPISGFGFACYGLLLCSLGMVDEGCRFADLGMDLQEKCGGQEYLARVYLMAYLFSYASKYPVHNSIGPLLYAYRTGLATGDTEYACFGAQFAGHSAVYSSQPLQRTFDDMKMYRSAFVAYKQHLVLAYHEVLMQMVANLLGEAPNQSILEGEWVVSFEKAVRFAKDEKHQSLQYELFGLNMIVAYLCNDLKRAKAMITPLRRLDEKVVMLMAVRIANFFLGLTLVALAEKTKNFVKRKYYLSGARIILWKFRRAAKSSPCNCLKNVLLLEAELEVLARGRLEAGLMKYDEAIVVAGEEDALMEQGIASERAARALHKVGRTNEAAKYKELAISYYSKWGCKIKVDQLRGDKGE